MKSLYTVNAEYQKKIAELTELTNDMDNLLVSTDVHMLLDSSLSMSLVNSVSSAIFSDTRR